MLVHADGAGAHRICTSERLCGHPATPRFSPNGRGIAFVDGQTGRLGVVAPDGTCLWCLVGKPLTTLRGRGPMFAGDGAVVLVARGGGRVRRVSLTGAKRAPTVAAHAADAVISSRGGLAIVRRGWIDVPPAAGGS